MYCKHEHVHSISVHFFVAVQVQASFDLDGFSLCHGYGSGSLGAQCRQITSMRSLRWKDGGGMRIQRMKRGVHGGAVAIMIVETHIGIVEVMLKKVEVGEKER